MSDRKKNLSASAQTLRQYENRKNKATDRTLHSSCLIVKIPELISSMIREAAENEGISPVVIIFISLTRYLNQHYWKKQPKRRSANGG